MEKDKGLFSFRKHPVGNFLDGKKGRKRKGGRLRRSMGFLMAAALIFNTLPASGLAVSASEQEKGLCEHHRSHTADCGYMEAQPCTHEHGEECYTTVTECVHTHTDECYPEVEETEESTGEESATTSDAEGREPSNCTHVCSEQSGCITKILDCHHEHDESCGYQEAQDCDYVCEICNGTEPEDTENNAENDTENAGTDTAECICETLCTEDSINGDCPVCGAEDADLSSCKGEKTEEQEKTGEKVITAWEWIDPEKYLTDGMLALPGAGRENPAFAEDVTALLPEKIQAEVAAVTVAEDGEETEEDAEALSQEEGMEIALTGWECASYPEDGAYEGVYTFTAFLPEGFVLAEDTAALEVEVELGGAMMLAATVSADYQEAAWNGSEVTYTGKTETCTPVESSADAVTWAAGWYVVNSTVTISEPITVTGAVNLILADGCTLNAEKGIVVETGNSLTIYAQSGGTGTLNATGADSAGIGGAGRTDYGVDGGSSGAITIYGGNITATSQNGAGIGGGAPWSGAKGGSGSNITIYGGSVTAASTSTQAGGAGIGGGGGGTDGGTGENINIYGGTVNVTGGTKGAGIGGGGSGAGKNPDQSLYESGDGTNITIIGGNVTAVGGQYAAGIGGGGGYYSSYTWGDTTYSNSCTGGAGSVTITGGIVDATGGAGNSSGNYAGDPIGNGGNTSGAADVKIAEGYAVYQNGVPVNKADSPVTGMTGAVTVKACDHAGVLIPNDNGYQHGGPCKWCGAELTAANHTLGADNQCSGCGAELVAEVTPTGGSTHNYYTDLEEALKSSNQTVKLLCDISASQMVTSNGNGVTLDLNGKTYTCIKQTAFEVPPNCSLTIKGSGEVTASGFYCFGVMTGGTLNIESGSFSAVDSAVYVASGGTLQLTGGSFTGERSAIEYESGEVTEALKNYGGTETPHYAFYQGSSPYAPSDSSLPSGTFTVRECEHDGVTPTSNNDGTHALKCPYCGYSETAANCTYVFSGTTGTCAACGDSVTVAVSGTENLIYDGTGKEPEVTVTRNGTELTANADYTVAYDNNKNAGENKATVTVTIGNNQGTYNGNFTIGKATPTIAWSSTSQEPTYTGQQAVITAPTVTLENNENFSGTISYSYKKQGETAYKDGLPTDAGTYTIKAHVDAEGNYNAADSTNELPLTIKKAGAEITVGTAAYHVAYGDPAFTISGITDTNPETAVQYAVTKGTDVVSVENGTVTIRNAGTATITVSLPATANYNAAENKTITVTVAKASAPSVENELKQYIKTKGSGGEAAVVDVAGKLPADRGKTTYKPVSSDDSSILSDAAVDQNGKLTYKVGAGDAGSTASIQVTAEMENYTDAVFNLEITLVEVIRAEIKAEAENAVYDGSPQKGYADGITCDYPVAGYAFAYKGREETAYDSSEPPVDAGSYTVTVSVSDQSGDYEGSVSLMFTIDKASITIKADDKTAEKGSLVPELTYTASGLAEKDMLAAAPKLVCDADMKTEGSYPITVSGAKVPDAKNYYEEITYKNGMLAVRDSAVHVTGVSLDKSALSLSEGATGQLTADLSPENATDKSVSWASSSTAAASVDSRGKVTAVREGTAVITVTTADGGYTASCTVTVTKDRGSGSTGGGSGSTGGGSGSTGGSFGSGGSGSTGGSTDTKQPFIKDSSGREGWDVIRAEAETAAAAPAGGTVAVDMNGAVSVPGSIFAAVCGKDVTLSFDMGSGVTWSVNGKDVTAEAAGDTDFSVTADAGAIPKELLAETAGGLAHLEISLAHEGAFGFTATLTLRITGRDGNGTAIGGSGTAAEYTGMYANLFYYNPDLRSLEFVCAGQIREDGTADLPFVHASDYTVILSAAPMGGTGTLEEPEKPQEPAAEAKVKSVKLSKTLYTYDGKLKKPAVLAVDTEGRRISARYYTVSYKNNRKAGKATATVKFKGGYSGTVKKTFTIRPAGTSIQKLTAVSGGFAVKWKKKTVQTGGYQIQYSANAGFQGSSTHSVFVKKNTAVKKTVKNLKAGKKYYVRIRTYQTVKADGKSARIYSAWSRAARVNTLPVSRKKTASSGRDRAFLMVEKEDGKKRAA